VVEIASPNTSIEETPLSTHLNGKLSGVKDPSPGLSLKTLLKAHEKSKKKTEVFPLF
jgi:hypothetical protein